MTVQVLYKNKAKSSNIGVIVLFSEDKFQIKNTDGYLSKNQMSYIEKILKAKIYQTISRRSVVSVFLKNAF